jgi:hypothetical protein
MSSRMSGRMSGQDTQDMIGSIESPCRACDLSRARGRPDEARHPTHDDEKDVKRS